MFSRSGLIVRMRIETNRLLASVAFHEPRQGWNSIAWGAAKRNPRKRSAKPKRTPVGVAQIIVINDYMVLTGCRPFRARIYSCRCT